MMGYVAFGVIFLGLVFIGILTLVAFGLGEI